MDNQRSHQVNGPTSVECCSAGVRHRVDTRKKELITLKKVYVLRRILNPMGTMDAIDFLLDKLHNTKNDAEFFESMNT
jgi:transcription termination factor Rho